MRQPRDPLPEAEKAHAFLLKLGRTLRQLGDAPAIEAEACRLLGEHLAVDRAYFAEALEGQHEVHVRHDHPRGDSPSLVGTHRDSDLGWSCERMRRGETAVVPRADRRAMNAFRIAAHIDVPLLRKGTLIGVLCVAESNPRQWTEVEIELVQETAALILPMLACARAERALRDCETRLQTAIEDVPLAMALTGPAGEILFRNPRFDQLWGRPAHVTTAQTYSECYEGYHLDGRPIASQEWPGARAVLKGEVVENEVYEIVQASGRRIKCWFGAAPIRDASGNISGGVVVFRDVTEELRTQAALRENEVRLQKANRTKDEFLAMLGHELRNPLAPIATTLQLMKMRSPDVFVREREIIGAQAKHLTALVDDLLDVARIAHDKFDLDSAPVKLAEVVAAAVETAQPQMEESRQSVHTHLADGLVIRGDRRRLVQVLVNLLSNAAKYSPPGRGIHVSAVAEDGQAVLRVRDQGQGIDPELLPHVFDSFTQGAQSIDRARGGLGLGLTIVRNVVRLHGGSVQATSEGPGRGSEFTVRLPLLAPAEMQAAAQADDGGRAEARNDSKGIKVLVVEDYAPAAESLALLLQEMGHRTRIARDGAAALQAIEEFEPDVALVDIGLPGIDGYGVVRSVRGTRGRERLPLIAITGYGQASDHARVMTAGFDEHLVKPLDAGRIGEVIDGLLQRDRPRADPP